MRHWRANANSGVTRECRQSSKPRSAPPSIQKKQAKTNIYIYIYIFIYTYGLSSAWLHMKEQRQLDGFHAKCPRKLLRVRPSYFSRVSNQKILEQSGQVSYTVQLLKQQLLLYGKIARAPDSDALRKLTFCDGSLQAASDKYVRRVGRPRHEWATQLHGNVLKVVGTRNVKDTVYGEASWKIMVNRYLSECRRA